MGDFPLFRDGKLVFSQGKLATTCETPYDKWNLATGGWESHGGPFHDPPCSAPNDWPGPWEIVAPCFGGVCEGAPRPLLSLYVLAGNTCDWAAAVLTDWGCNEVRINMGSPPFSGTGTWTVWIGGGEISMAVDAVAGQPFAPIMSVPEPYRSPFDSPGRCEVRSRLTMEFPGGTLYDLDNTTFVYCEDYEGIRKTGIPAIVPQIVQLNGGIIHDDDGRYTMALQYLKGAYQTYDRAAEVMNGYETAISEYADRCACMADCGDGGDSNVAKEVSGPYSGVLESSGGEKGAPSGCGFAFVDCAWSVRAYGIGITLTMQVWKYVDGTWQWIDVGTNNSGSSAPTIGPAYLWPCENGRVWLDVASGGGGLVEAFAEYQPRGTSNTCDDAIRDAFDLVPND